MFALSALIALVLAAASQSTVYDGGYDKDVIKVHKGERVTWLFDQSNNQNHTVTYEKGPKGSKFFDSKEKGPGTKYRYKFKVKGTYTLYCKNHGGMQQTVKVR